MELVFAVKQKAVTVILERTWFEKAVDKYQHTILDVSKLKVIKNFNWQATHLSESVGPIIMLIYIDGIWKKL